MSLPQRENRPALDILPEKTPNNAGWTAHYDNLPMNCENAPVPERKGNPDTSGWDDSDFSPSREKDDKEY